MGDIINLFVTRTSYRSVVLVRAISQNIRGKSTDSSKSGVCLSGVIDMQKKKASIFLTEDYKEQNAMN